MIGPLPYIGGKSRFAAQIVSLFPAHTTYVEPFCGGAHVFFREEPSIAEVLNDMDGELVNFLRVCQLHCEELLRYLAHAVHSRRWYDLLRQQDPALLTDVQRAARFFYLQRLSWGGRVHRQTYQYPLTSGGRIIASEVRRVLLRTSERLERVQLENWPYEKVLTRYDRPTTFFYLDPPYVEMPYYRFNFLTADFHQLAERLGNIRGRFLLSINDHPTSREAFRRFHLRHIEAHYTLARKRAFQELLISNYELPCGSNI